jgi:hypothetical protein
MNFIKSTIVASLLLLQGIPLAASTTSTSKRSQAQTKIAQVKTDVQNKKATKSSRGTSAPVKSSSTSAPESANVKSLIEDFMKDVAEIRCSCGVSKKGEKIDPKMLCKHDQDHAKKVKKAFESYKKLHEATNGSGKSIKEEDNKKVKSSVEKIFQCKNIQHMAWHPKITGQAASQKTASK